MNMSDEEGNICPFCREPNVCYNGHVKRLQKLTNNGNANAYYMLGIYYANELMGVQQDWNKANELYLKAGELGCAMGYNNLGLSYHKGTGVEVDKKKAKYFYELAAMKGDVGAR